MSALELALPDWAAPYFVGPDAKGHGLVKGLPEDLYHRTRALVSKSSLDKIAQTPSHYRYHLANPVVPTRAMVTGSALHTVVLEPDLFKQKFVVMPEFGNMRTNLAKAKRDEWIAEYGSGKTYLTAEEMATVIGMADSLRMHPTVRILLADFEPEVTIVWTDEETGLKCKGRIDALSRYAGGIPVDIKSARDASESGFMRAAHNRRYHVQDSTYIGGLRANGSEARNFILPAVESKPPYAVGVYQFRSPSLIAGDELRRRDMRTLAKCLKTDHWPGYTENIRDIDIPNYGLAEAENMNNLDDEDEDEHDD